MKYINLKAQLLQIEREIGRRCYLESSNYVVQFVSRSSIYSMENTCTNYDSLHWLGLKFKSLGRENEQTKL